MISDEEDEFPPIEHVSICVDCAKHPALKQFVEANAVDGLECAVCIPISGKARACALERRQDLMNLLSGLVRLYYNEYEYNTHLGADDGVGGILSHDNPILYSENTLFNYRSEDRTHELIGLLFSENVYPAENEGISLFAGFDSYGIRQVNLSLSQYESLRLKRLRSRLQSENHYDVERAVFDLIDSLGDRISTKVPVGSRYFRTRIGTAGRFQRYDLGWNAEVRDQPYIRELIGTPPPPKATPGRLNRAGVAYLYLASDLPTAAAEVRPHPSHRLSVGQFECVEPLLIASFNTDISAFVSNERELDLFHFVQSTDRLMSVPMIPEEADRYLVTQLIADCLRQRGFDGVSYRSSVGPGENLCVFHPECLRYVDKSGEVHRVESLQYGLMALPVLLEPDEEFHRID